MRGLAALAILSPLFLPSLTNSPNTVLVESPGFTDLSLPNTTGKGSSNLLVRLYYPATASGRNAPIRKRVDGHPVVVFLHGYAVLGTYYGTLANHLARRGFVVALVNTAQRSAVTLVEDGVALYSALQTANGQAGHFLEGALDMRRAGLCGHSMGGGGAFAVLAQNPGYAAGLTLAPVNPGRAIVEQVKVPIGVIHGMGDTVVPWRSNGLQAYTVASNYRRLKFFYLFDESCTHYSPAGLWVSPGGKAVWARSSRIITGFFNRFLELKHEGMEQVVGATARAEGRLVDLRVEVEQPDLWANRSGSLGRTSRFEVLSEPGPIALLSAAGTTLVATSFGVLRLDPATITTVARQTGNSTGSLIWSVSVPNDSSLVGFQVPFQGIGIDKNGNVELTDLFNFPIGP